MNSRVNTIYIKIYLLLPEEWLKVLPLNGILSTLLALYMYFYACLFEALYITNFLSSYNIPHEHCLFGRTLNSVLLYFT